MSQNTKKTCWRVGIFGVELKSVCVDESDPGKRADFAHAWVTPLTFKEQENADDYIRFLIALNLVPEPIYTDVAPRSHESALLKGFHCLEDDLFINPSAVDPLLRDEDSFRDRTAYLISTDLFGGCSSTPVGEEQL